MRPYLRLAPTRDHTAIGFASRLPRQHRLLSAYRSLTADSDVISSLGIRQVDRDDLNWQVCIVKEVHALLASEAIVHALESPTVFVVRDPVATVDSILRTNGRSQYYLAAEAGHLLTCHDASAIAPGYEKLRETYLRSAQGGERVGSVLQLVYAVAALHLLFDRLAREYEHVHLVRYEDLCRDAEEHFSRLASALDLRWNQRSSTLR